MLQLRTQSECSSMSVINKMDAVMFFVDFPFLKNDSLKLNIVEKPNVHRKHPDYVTPVFHKLLPIRSLWNKRNWNGIGIKYFRQNATSPLTKLVWFVYIRQVLTWKGILYSWPIDWVKRSTVALNEWQINQSTSSHLNLPLVWFVRSTTTTMKRYDQ
jgi:hypothetical protein